MPPPWQPLKLLASQTLPLLATLRGREVLHAAGVVVGERLIAVVAASGTGKSATACNVIAQGGRFFADDVLAWRSSTAAYAPTRARACSTCSHSDLDAIPESGRARLGERLGQSDKVHLAPGGVLRGRCRYRARLPRPRAGCRGRPHSLRSRTRRRSCSATRSCRTSTRPRVSRGSSR